MAKKPQIRSAKTPLLADGAWEAELNDPESSNLSDDQLLVLEVALELERMFQYERVPRSQRDVLLRLHAEVSNRNVDDQDRRLYRAAMAIEEHVERINNRAGRLVTRGDVRSVLAALERLRFSVRSYWSEHEQECKELIVSCRLGRRGPKGTFGSAGVLARILFAANTGDSARTLEPLVKSISSAIGRQRERQK
jgi:hypothetical protein